MATSMDDGDSVSNDGSNDGAGDGGDGGGYDGSDESGPGENRGAPPVRIEAAPPAGRIVAVGEENHHPSAALLRDQRGAVDHRVEDSRSRAAFHSIS